MVRVAREECSVFSRSARRRFLYEVGFGLRVGIAIDGKFSGEAAFQAGVIFGIFGMRAQVVAKGDVAEKLGVVG